MCWPMLSSHVRERTIVEVLFPNGEVYPNRLRGGTEFLSDVACWDRMCVSYYLFDEKF